MRRLKKLATIAVSVASAGLILAACSSSSTTGTGAATGAVRGGTLTLVGSGDVDFFDTAAAYYDVTYTLFRAISRQLYQYPSASTTAAQVNPVPDLATALPTITNGGKTYTIHIRQGAKWNSTPPRQVTAADEVLGMKRLCNPVNPVGAPGYFEQTIVGMQAYCNGFANVNGTVAGIKNYIDSNNIAGVKAIDPTTVQFTLTQPASDFINILSMTFSSPAPVEDLNYLPGSPDLATHFLSDGPYAVQSYTPNKSITLDRNSAWESSTDPLRHAYVNAIDIQEGVATTPTAAVQQIQAGTADLEWDQNVDTAQLAGMVASHDPNLVIGPQGANNFITINPYIVINMQSPNNGGALQKPQVRQAMEYAINKTADSQIYGGSVISQALNQVVPGGSVGNIPGYDPYPTPGNNGDPTKAKALLAQAGYQPGQITLKLPYRTTTVHPQIAQTDQAALQAAGFNVQLIPVNPANTFYTKYLENPTASKAGAWDIAEAGWIPDWLGNNGRSIIEPLFDGRTYGPNSTDYGDYMSTATNSLIDKALSATSLSAATTAWQDAAKQIMADAAIVPVGAQKVAVYHSSRVQNCLFSVWTENCDVTNVWLKG
ncbi:MAG: ABC transporter substrate-binding protein [Acidimicrobiales bacterium]